MSDLKIDSNGVLKLPVVVRRHLGRDAIRVVSHSTGHLLLGRPDSDNPVLLSGLLGEVSVPDLLSFFNMFRKTGVLNFELDGGNKALFFKQGEIVFATSTFARDDLGEVLFSLGKVEREILQQVRQLVNGRITLGKLLVERGLVSPKDLWLAARSQVESIVYNLFAFQQGSFSYVGQGIEQEKQLRLSMNTQNLIMEGLRRQDEHALYMRRVISLDFFPMPTGKDTHELDQFEARLHNFALGGQQSARSLFRKAGVREFDGMRILYQLIEKGLLRMEDTPAIEIEGDLGQVLAIYNGLLNEIYTKMIEPFPGFDEEVANYLHDMPQPYSFVLRDVELNEKGALDGHRIVANLAGLEEGDKKKLLADALCELVFVETMAVRRELDADQAKPLIAKVQDITTRVRELVGRPE